MRGLSIFISDIRNCKSTDEEEKRINKELANIRNKFRNHTLDGYQKKKYVCKLLFIFLLGHDLDFGHIEAVNLLSSNKYTEKQIGYLFLSILINKNSDLIKLIIQAIKQDLNSSDSVFVNLSLQCVANIGSKEMADSCASVVSSLLISSDTSDEVKQSAALSLLRLFSYNDEILPRNDDWPSRVVNLLNSSHMGVVTASVSLIDSLVKHRPADYEECVELAINRLFRIISATAIDYQDYSYYGVTAPFLSVKLLKLLQNYPYPADNQMQAKLNGCLDLILSKADETFDKNKTKKFQYFNAKHAVMFETINLITIHDSEPKLLIKACNLLGKFLINRETNLRYLSLEALCKLASCDTCQETIKEYTEAIVTSMKLERDISVRQQAVDVLYAICDRENAEIIVSELLLYLQTADYSVHGELVLKIAILAEKCAEDFTWYVDVILQMILISGEFVSEEIINRVIHIVVNHTEIQGYAAKRVFESLQVTNCHENLIKIAGFILGEYGNLIAGDNRSSPMIQFKLLHNKYALCSRLTKSLLLTTFVKFSNLFPEIKLIIQEVFRNQSNLRNSDIELQQRASEYLQLSTIASNDFLAVVFEEMPCFPEKKSTIEEVLHRKKTFQAVN